MNMHIRNIFVRYINIVTDLDKVVFSAYTHVFMLLPDKKVVCALLKILLMKQIGVALF